MSHGRKRKKSFMDEIFSGSIIDEFERLFSEFSSGEVAGGYSISVVQTPEGTVVRARVGKDVDVNELRRRLERQYQGARIEIEGGRREPLIREISTREIEEKG
ncbi:MAG: hypothetical protein QXH19_04190 [Candidatus Bathyarchaeia archaeon]